MEIISIATPATAAGIRNDLAQEIASLHGYGIVAHFRQTDRGAYSLLHCYFEEDDPTGGNGGRNRVFRYYLADILTGLILDVITRQILHQILARDYAFFGEEEREEIFQEALRCLEEPTDGLVSPRLARRERILNRLLRYLEDHDQLILEGFVRFRLKDYYEELKEATGRAVERFFARREYEEFIRLLRYLVDLQPSRLAELNVKLEENGDFVLFDETGRPVEHEQLRSLLAEITEEEIDRSDLLLSALVTIAPMKIVVHTREILPVVETIGRVFGPRMAVCPGCPLCFSNHRVP